MTPQSSRDGDSYTLIRGDDTVNASTLAANWWAPASTPHMLSYERCKATHRCPRAYAHYDPMDASLSFSRSMFRGGRRERAGLWLDFEDWRQGTMGIEPALPVTQAAAVDPASPSPSPSSSSSSASPSGVVVSLSSNGGIDGDALASILAAGEVLTSLAQGTAGTGNATSASSSSSASLSSAARASLLSPYAQTGRPVPCAIFTGGASGVSRATLPQSGLGTLTPVTNASGTAPSAAVGDADALGMGSSAGCSVSVLQVPHFPTAAVHSGGLVGPHFSSFSLPVDGDSPLHGHLYINHGGGRGSSAASGASASASGCRVTADTDTLILSVECASWNATGTGTAGGSNPFQPENPSRYATGSIPPLYMPSPGANTSYRGALLWTQRGRGVPSAVWHFTSIYVGRSVDIRVVGSRPAAFVSRSSLAIDTPIIVQPGTLGGFAGASLRMGVAPPPVFLPVLRSSYRRDIEREAVQGAHMQAQGSNGSCNGTGSSGSSSSVASDRVRSLAHGSQKALAAWLSLDSGGYLYNALATYGLQPPIDSASASGDPLLLVDAASSGATGNGCTVTTINGIAITATGTGNASASCSLSRALAATLPPSSLSALLDQAVVTSGDVIGSGCLSHASLLAGLLPASLAAGGNATANSTTSGGNSTAWQALRSASLTSALALSGWLSSCLHAHAMPMGLATGVPNQALALATPQSTSTVTTTGTGTGSEMGATTTAASSSSSAAALAASGSAFARSVFTAAGYSLLSGGSARTRTGTGNITQFRFASASGPDPGSKVRSSVDDSGLTGALSRPFALIVSASVLFPQAVDAYTPRSLGLVAPIDSPASAARARTAPVAAATTGTAKFASFSAFASASAATPSGSPLLSSLPPSSFTAGLPAPANALSPLLRAPTYGLLTTMSDRGQLQGLRASLAAMQASVHGLMQAITVAYNASASASGRFNASATSTGNVTVSGGIAALLPLFNNTGTGNGTGTGISAPSFAGVPFASMLAALDDAYAQAAAAAVAGGIYDAYSGMVLPSPTLRSVASTSGLPEDVASASGSASASAVDELSSLLVSLSAWGDTLPAAASAIGVALDEVEAALAATGEAGWGACVPLLNPSQQSTTNGSAAGNVSSSQGFTAPFSGWFPTLADVVTATFLSALVTASPSPYLTSPLAALVAAANGDTAAASRNASGGAWWLPGPGSGPLSASLPAANAPLYGYLASSSLLPAHGLSPSFDGGASSAAALSLYNASWWPSAASASASGTGNDVAPQRPWLTGGDALSVPSIPSSNATASASGGTSSLAPFPAWTAVARDLTSPSTLAHTLAPLAALQAGYWATLFGANVTLARLAAALASEPRLSGMPTSAAPLRYWPSTAPLSANASLPPAAAYLPSFYFAAVDALALQAAGAGSSNATSTLNASASAFPAGLNASTLLPWASANLHNTSAQWGGAFIGASAAAVVKICSGPNPPDACWMPALLPQAADILLRASSASTFSATQQAAARASSAATNTSSSSNATSCGAAAFRRRLYSPVGVSRNASPRYDAASSSLAASTLSPCGPNCGATRTYLSTLLLSSSPIKAVHVVAITANAGQTLRGTWRLVLHSSSTNASAPPLAATRALPVDAEAGTVSAALLADMPHVVGDQVQVSRLPLSLPTGSRGNGRLWAGANTPTVNTRPATGWAWIITYTGVDGQAPLLQVDAGRLQGVGLNATLQVISPGSSLRGSVSLSWRGVDVPAIPVASSGATGNNDNGVDAASSTSTSDASGYRVEPDAGGDDAQLAARLTDAWRGVGAQSVAVTRVTSPLCSCLLHADATTTTSSSSSSGNGTTAQQQTQQKTTLNPARSIQQACGLPPPEYAAAGVGFGTRGCIPTGSPSPVGSAVTLYITVTSDGRDVRSARYPSHPLHTHGIGLPSMDNDYSGWMQGSGTGAQAGAASPISGATAIVDADPGPCVPVDLLSVSLVQAANASVPVDGLTITTASPVQGTGNATGNATGNGTRVSSSSSSSPSLQASSLSPTLTSTHPMATVIGAVMLGHIPPLPHAVLATSLLKQSSALQYQSTPANASSSSSFVSGAANSTGASSPLPLAGGVPPIRLGSPLPSITSATRAFGLAASSSTNASAGTASALAAGIASLTASAIVQDGWPLQPSPVDLLHSLHGSGIGSIEAYPYASATVRTGRYLGIRCAHNGSSPTSSVAPSSPLCYRADSARFGSSSGRAMGSAGAAAGSAQVAATVPIAPHISSLSLLAPSTLIPLLPAPHRALPAALPVRNRFTGSSHFYALTTADMPPQAPTPLDDEAQAQASSAQGDAASSSASGGRDGTAPGPRMDLIGGSGGASAARTWIDVAQAAEAYVTSHASLLANIVRVSSSYGNASTGTAASPSPALAAAQQRIRSLSAATAALAAAGAGGSGGGALELVATNDLYLGPSARIVVDGAAGADGSHGGSGGDGGVVVLSAGGACTVQGQVSAQGGAGGSGSVGAVGRGGKGGTVGMWCGSVELQRSFQRPTLSPGTTATASAANTTANATSGAQAAQSQTILASGSIFVGGGAAGASAVTAVFVDTAHLLRHLTAVSKRFVQRSTSTSTNGTTAIPATWPRIASVALARACGLNATLVSSLLTGVPPGSGTSFSGNNTSNSTGNGTVINGAYGGNLQSAQYAWSTTYAWSTGLREITWTPTCNATIARLLLAASTAASGAGSAGSLFGDAGYVVATASVRPAQGFTAAGYSRDVTVGGAMGTTASLRIVPQPKPQRPYAATPGLGPAPATEAPSSSSATGAEGVQSARPWERAAGVQVVLPLQVTAVAAGWRLLALSAACLPGSSGVRSVGELSLVCNASANNSTANATTGVTSGTTYPPVLASLPYVDSPYTPFPAWSTVQSHDGTAAEPSLAYTLRDPGPAYLTSATRTLVSAARGSTGQRVSEALGKALGVPVSAEDAVTWWTRRGLLPASTLDASTAAATLTRDPTGLAEAASKAQNLTINGTRVSAILSCVTQLVLSSQRPSRVSLFARVAPGYSPPQPAAPAAAPAGMKRSAAARKAQAQKEQGTARRAQKASNAHQQNATSTASAGSTTAAPGSNFGERAFDPAGLLDPSEASFAGRHALHIALFDDTAPPASPAIPSAPAASSIGGGWYGSWIAGYAASVLHAAAVTRMNGGGAYATSANATKNATAGAGISVGPIAAYDTIEVLHETAASTNFVDNSASSASRLPGRRPIARASIVNTTAMHAGLAAVRLSYDAAGAEGGDVLADGRAAAHVYAPNADEIDGSGSTAPSVSWRLSRTVYGAGAGGMGGMGPVPTMVNGDGGDGSTIPAAPETPVMIGVGIVDGHWTHDAGYTGLPQRHYSQSTRKHMDTLRLAALAGTWVKIDVFIDWDTHTYSVRLNDVTVAREQPFTGAALTRLGLYVPSASGAQAAWFDEIYVGEDDSMGFECPVPAEEPQRGPTVADADRNIVADSLGKPLLVVPDAEVNDATRNAATGGSMRRVRPLPSSDWRVSDVGPPSSFNAMMRHTSFLSNRQMYVHEYHAGLLFSDGTPHRFFHSDMPVPIQRMPYAVQPLPPVDWWSNAVPIVNTSWTSGPGGLGLGQVLGWNTTGAAALSSVQLGIASSLGLIQGVDGVSVGTTMAVMPYFYFPTTVPVGDLLRSATAIGPMQGAGITDSLPYSNTIPFPTMSALAYPDGIEGNGYDRSFTSPDGTSGQSTSPECSYIELPASAYLDLAAASVRKALAARSLPSSSRYDASMAKPFDHAVVKALAQAGVLVAALGSPSPSAPLRVAIFNCSDDTFAAASFDDVYGPQPSLVDSLNDAIDGLYELNVTSNQPMGLPLGSLSALQLLGLLNETDYAHAAGGTLPYGMLANALVTYAGYTGSGFTGASAIGGQMYGGLAQVGAGTVANGVDPSGHGALYDDESAARLEAYTGASMRRAASAPTRPRYNPRFNAHAVAAQTQTGSAAAGWTQSGDGKRLSPRRASVLGQSAAPRTASVSLGAALYVPQSYLQASHFAATHGDLDSWRLSAHDPVIAAVNAMHTAYVRSLTTANATMSMDPLLLARFQRASGADAGTGESFTSGLLGATDFYQPEGFAEQWLYDAGEGLASPTGAPVPPGYNNGVSMDMVQRAATSASSRREGQTITQRSTAGFDATTSLLARSAYFTGDGHVTLLNAALQPDGKCRRPVIPLASLPTDYPSAASLATTGLDDCWASILASQQQATSGYLGAFDLRQNDTTLSPTPLYNESIAWAQAKGFPAVNASRILEFAAQVTGELTGARGRHYWYTEHDNAWLDTWDSGRWYTTGGIGACSSDDLQGSAWRNEGIMLHFANITGPAANANYTLVTQPEDFSAIPALNAAAQAALFTAANGVAGYIPFGTLWMSALGLSPAGSVNTFISGAIGNGLVGNASAPAAVFNGSRLALDACLNTPPSPASLLAGAVGNATTAAFAACTGRLLDQPMAQIVAVSDAVANVTDYAGGRNAGLLGSTGTATAGVNGVSSGIWRAERPKVIARTIALPPWVVAALQGSGTGTATNGAAAAPQYTAARQLATGFASGLIPSASPRQYPTTANTRVGKNFPVAKSLYYGSLGMSFTNLTNSVRTAVYANARANIAATSRQDASTVAECVQLAAVQATQATGVASDLSVLQRGLGFTAPLASSLGTASVASARTNVSTCFGSLSASTAVSSVLEDFPAVQYANGSAAGFRSQTTGSMFTADGTSSVHDISIAATLASAVPVAVITNASTVGWNVSWFAQPKTVAGASGFSGARGSGNGTTSTFTLLEDAADTVSTTVYVMWMAVSDVYYALLPNASTPGMYGQPASSWWVWGGDGEGFAPPPPPEAASPRFRVAGVALSLHPAGPFLFLHALMPDGNSTVDLTIFQQRDLSQTHTAAQQASVAAGSAAQGLVQRAAASRNCSQLAGNVSAVAACLNVTAPQIATATALGAGGLLSKASSGPAHIVRTYFATTRYILPAPVVQPVWESVKQTVKRLPFSNRTTAASGGDVNPLVFTFPGWYNSSDLAIYDDYVALTDEDDQDFALNYQRAHYSAGYDNPKDIYKQHWRREDREWLAYSGLWEEKWDEKTQLFTLYIRPNVTSPFDVMAGLPPPFHPALSGYWDPLYKLPAVAQDAVDAVVAGALVVSYIPSDRDEVLAAVFDKHAPRQLGMLGRPPISSRYLDPRDPINSGWRPASVPSVRAQPYFFNYRDGNIVDNPTHPSITDLLIAPWHVVEMRRTKYVGVSRLTDDYLGCEVLQAVIEGASVEGQPLQELLLSQAYAASAVDEPVTFDSEHGASAAEHGGDSEGNPFGWSQRVDTPSTYIDPLSHLVVTERWNANDTSITTSGLLVAVAAAGATPSTGDRNAALESGWRNDTFASEPGIDVYAPPSTFPIDVYGSDAPFYALPSSDWRDRHWQFNLSYSDRWHDYRNFRDRQALRIDGHEDCSDIHDRAMLQYTECARILANETVWGDTPTWENYLYLNRSYSRALNTDKLERCYRLHAELLDAYDQCLEDARPDFAKLQEWSFGHRECVGGGGICGPPAASINASAVAPYGYLQNISISDAVRIQGLGAPYDKALPPPQPWAVDKSSPPTSAALRHGDTLAGQPELLQVSGRQAGDISASVARQIHCDPWALGTDECASSPPWEAVYASLPNGTSLVTYIGNLRFNTTQYAGLLGINGTAFTNSSGYLIALANGTVAVPDSLPLPCVDDQLKPVPCSQQVLETTIMRPPIENERDLADEDDIEKGKERMPPVQLSIGSP